MTDIPYERDSHGFAESMLDGLSLLTRAERIRASFLVASIIVNSLLQTVVLLGVVQVVQLMVGLAGVTGGRIFAYLQRWTGEATDESNLLIFCALLAAVTLLRAVFGWLQVGWMSNFSQTCEVRMSTMVMRQVVNSPYEWHMTQNPERVREVLFGHAVQWSRDFVRTCIQIGNDVTFIAFLLAILMVSSPATGAGIGVATAALGTLMFAIVRPRVVKIAKEKRDALIRAHIVSTETIRGIKDVKMAGAENKHVASYLEQLLVYAGSDARIQIWRQTPRLVLELVAYFALIGMSCTVILTGSRGSEIAGIMVLYALAALRMLPMVNTIIASSGSLLGSFPIISELARLVRASDTASADAPVRTGAAWEWSRIELKDIGYFYPANEKPALSAVTRTIERGRSYGIVGPSGGGKSTLVDLIAGLIAPTTGSLSVGGRTVVSDVDRLDWRHHFGYVSQRPFLLDATLRENIAFGYDDGTDDARLKRAIELARLGKLIDRMPKGLESLVGDQGSNLSGGERQRVAIARALYRGAEILVLDEATSALDSLVEREIAEEIEALRGRVTPIVVSHRLGLVRACDEIWVVDRGQIVASGRHDALMSDSGLYSRMNAAQDFHVQQG